MARIRLRNATIGTLQVTEKATIGGVEMNTLGIGYVKEYFVDNVVGASTNDGSSWEKAMDQPSVAITAWAALLATYDNLYVRAAIYIRGTATAYTTLTALPSYCDMIGVGAEPSGNGTGIARIGPDAGAYDGVLVSASVRGLNCYNLQFQAGNGKYAFKGTNLFRSRFENCVFAGNGAPVAQAAAGFEMGICSGVVFKDCLWNNQSSADVQFTVGFNITSTHFHGCRVEGCYIVGDVGIAIASGCVNAWGSWFKDCYIGVGGGACSIGVDDNATTGHIIYANCWVQATDAFELTNNAARIIGCYAANALAT